MSQNEQNDLIYVAKTAAVFEHDGSRVHLRPGITRVRAGHPMLEGREHLFTPLEVHYDTETTTDRPGQKRSTPKPAKDAESTGDGSKSKGE